MAEPVRTSNPPAPAPKRRVSRQSPIALAAESGCETVDIPRDKIEDHEGRIEYWEDRTEQAVLLREPATIYHERPSDRLAKLTERIAASRGSPIEAFGTADLVRPKAGGGFRSLMQADQILYLDPGAAPAGARVDVDGDTLPDVVLEVDYSTDARVWKLPRFEAWGFPEVWVDVPDERSHPRSRLSGLTIHVHDGERFREASSSRAFPGWTAEEIHVALSRSLPSPETLEVLRRVGRALGAREGTGPDDDPWLRAERAEGRDEGRAEGRAEGRLEGLASGRARMIVALLEARGIEASGDLVKRLADLGGLSEVELAKAAQTCADEADLLRLLRR